MHPASLHMVTDASPPHKTLLLLEGQLLVLFGSVLFGSTLLGWLGSAVSPSQEGSVGAQSWPELFGSPWLGSGGAHSAVLWHESDDEPQVMPLSSPVSAFS